jgi:hypothetical protein
MPIDDRDWLRQAIKDPTIPERAKMQWVKADRETTAGPPQQSIRLETIQRYGDLVFVFPDGDRHERRIQRATPSGSDRVFWVTLTIACGAPRFVSGKKKSNVLAKKFGALVKARNDLDALHQYYRPMAVGAPEVQSPQSPGLFKSPGFFEWSEALDNPTIQDLGTALRRVQQWLHTNQSDPEYTSFQFNLCFSGHAELSETGVPSVVLADQSLDAQTLTAMVLQSIPVHEDKPETCRLDLFLDCCCSSAVARSVHLSLVDKQLDVDRSRRSVLEIGQVYCACLDDEESFELTEIVNSVFTFAFLNECSRMRPDGAKTTNLGLRDVGWYTEGRQHPILIDFTVPEGWALKFPSRYHLTHPPQNLKRGQTSSDVSIDEGHLSRDPIGEFIRLAHQWRHECVPIERELRAKPDLRTPFSRDELMTNKRFPFL